MKSKSIVLLCLFGWLLTGFSACMPPRCKIPNCHVVIDHNHARYGETVSGGEAATRVYRGLPWYRYAFRKKYKAKNSMGRYRKIDTREAYDKQ
ncbi:MAG: hypothetical protein MUE85_22945 [Microscillaceae bacterium]|jgi:hypothetical protein|nr:hypothetical protein [Microscillaceae bacterium]